MGVPCMFIHYVYLLTFTPMQPCTCRHTMCSRLVSYTTTLQEICTTSRSNIDYKIVPLAGICFRDLSCAATNKLQNI